MRARINVISHDYQARGLTRKAAKRLASRMVKVYPRLWALNDQCQPRYREAMVYPGLTPGFSFAYALMTDWLVI